MATITEIKYGSGSLFNVNPVRAVGSGGIFNFSEKIVNSIDPRFDALLLLGISMNHNTSNQNVVNSWLWTGFSKAVKRIDKLWLLSSNVSIDEPSSETAQYTQVKVLATLTDHGNDQFCDLNGEGVISYGWVRNFYNSDGIAAQNLLQVWDGAALRNMAVVQRAAVENHFANWVWQSPNSYDYQQCPIECEKPIVFYHWVAGNVSPHSQYGMINMLFGVRFFRRKRWWRL